MLSVILITRNEEKNLRRCLKSLPRHDSLIVVDSQSSDQTVSIAKEFGAQVTVRAFTDYAEQKNACLDRVKTGWVFSIDADEELDSLLRGEIEAVCYGNARKQEAFRVLRRQFFLGRLLRFGKTQSRPLRLFRKNGGRFSGRIHEEVLTGEGPVGFLNGMMIHHSYPTLSEYFMKFNEYTSKASPGKNKGRIVLNQLRFWPEFIYRYFFCLGFLDGFSGYSYALLSSFYHWVKYLKRYERLTRERSL